MINHSWEKLNNGTQNRCRVCGCIRTRKYSKGKTEFIYQYNSIEVTENKGCIEKRDLSEFFK